MHRRLRPPALAAAVVVVLASLGALAVFASASTSAAPHRAMVQAPAAAAHPGKSATPGVRALEPATPTTLLIPALHIDAPIQASGVNPDGSPQVPALTQPGQVNWDTGAAIPGTDGAAILVGHLDTWQGPAVFEYLSTLRPGDEIEVERDDTQTATFTVDAVAQYPKDAIPTAKVYGDPGYPALRLITCGGPFDTRTREYQDNTVVYAHLVASHVGP